MDKIIVDEFSDLEFDQSSDEETEVDLSEAKKAIFTDKSDPEIDSLYNKHKKGKLVLQPEFQRQFVWDSVKASRLIESALLDIPLPIIYLSEEKDGNLYVIDGQQRLTSFFSFIDGKLPDGSDFKLNHLKVFTEHNKKKYVDLDEKDQDKIKSFTVRTITFKKESEKDLKFEIFERLNTGSVQLNDQELRNCIYRGPYNELLKELSTDKDFRYLLGLSKPDRRSRDIGLVLRFAAFYHRAYLNFKPPIRKFLNDDMEELKLINKDKSNDLRKAFKNSVSIIKTLLGENSFKRFYRGDGNDHNGYWETKKFNVSLYDILMNTFAREDKNTVIQHLDSIREAFIDLMVNDEEFITSIEKSTSSKQAVTIRFDKWRNALKEVIGVGQKEPRLFTSAFKEKLFKKEPSCSICHQKISDVDDAAVDHIKQYWKGGKTIPENARLTHRFCNFSRSKHDEK